MSYKPIIATLGYIYCRETNCVLMIHRNARADDLHLGKYNGLGGKVERDEDVGTCMVREVREEAGIEVTQMQLAGTINWPGFGKNGEDWFGFIFLITQWHGEPWTSNAEGTLEWVALDSLLAGQVPLWEGDKHFLPLIFQSQPQIFHGVMPYENGSPKAWSYTTSEAGNEIDHDV